MTKVLKVVVASVLFYLTLIGVSKPAQSVNSEPVILLSEANLCSNMPICRWGVTQDDSVAELKALQETRPTLLS